MIAPLRPIEPYNADAVAPFKNVVAFDIIGIDFPDVLVDTWDAIDDD